MHMFRDSLAQSDRFCVSFSIKARVISLVWFVILRSELYLSSEATANIES